MEIFKQFHGLTKYPISFPISVLTEDHHIQLAWTATVQAEAKIDQPRLHIEPNKLEE